LQRLLRGFNGFNRGISSPHVILEAEHEVKRFSAIRKVKALSWMPAFVGMTPEDLLKGFDYFKFSKHLLFDTIAWNKGIEMNI
jgi:hypothetical protein